MLLNFGVRWDAVTRLHGFCFSAFAGEWLTRTAVAFAVEWKLTKFSSAVRCPAKKAEEWRALKTGCWFLEPWKSSSIPISVAITWREPVGSGWPKPNGRMKFPFVVDGLKGFPEAITTVFPLAMSSTPRFMTFSQNLAPSFCSIQMPSTSLVPSLAMPKAS